MIPYYILITFVFIYIFITGFHDEGNLIATIISSRSIKIKPAFLIASVAQLLGTIVLSTTVVSTIGRDIIKYDYIIKNHANIHIMLLAGILGATIWNLVTWFLGIPSSSSHALIGGLIGPFFLEYGYRSINLYGIYLKVLTPLFVSPIIGFILGYMIMAVTGKLFQRKGIKVNSVLKKLQHITVFLLNSGQGANDAQKGMGVIAVAMLVAGKTGNFGVPYWVKIISAFMISFGLIMGGLRMIKSVGTGIYRVRPFHSFNAQLSSLIIVITSTLIGAPISGTQVVNSSLLGVGAEERPKAVKWQFVKGMVMAWIITIPASFIVSCIIYVLICGL